MNRLSKVMALFVCSGFVCGCFAQMAIKFKGSDGWGLVSRYEQSYNSFNTETFTGQITKIDTITPIRDMAYGVQITVKKGDVEVPVQLGPAWYILHQDMNLSIKSTVEIKGCNANIDGKQVYMAVYVKSLDAGKILRLRDTDGLPYWCAFRKQ